MCIKPTVIYAKRLHSISAHSIGAIVGLFGVNLCLFLRVALFQGERDYFWLFIMNISMNNKDE